MKEFIYDINIDNEFILNKFSGSVVLDIETTGLSRKYNSIFLIGILEIKKESEIRLFFAENPEEEYKLINSVKKYLDRNIVTYNGNTFDIPFIKERAEIYNIEIPEIKGFDLYRYITKFRNIINLKNYKQKSVEEYIGLYRDDFISGAEVVNRYKDYVKNGDFKAFEDVIIHNKDDIYGLYRSLEIVKNIEQFNSFNISNKMFIIDNIKFEGNTLNISGKTNFDEINIFNMFSYSLKTSDRFFEIEIPAQKAKYDAERLCTFVLKKDFPKAENKERIPSPDKIIILSLDGILYNNLYEIVNSILEENF